MSTELIENPAIVKKCYDAFFIDMYWFTVVTILGEVWFDGIGGR
jgi:hypothetical protein